MYLWIQSPYFPYIGAGQRVDQPATIGLIEPQDTRLCEYIDYTGSSSSSSSSSSLSPPPHTPVRHASETPSIKAEEEQKFRRRKRSPSTAVRQNRNAVTPTQRDHIRWIMRARRGQEKPMPWREIRAEVHRIFGVMFNIPTLEMMHQRDKLRPPGPRRVRYLLTFRCRWTQADVLSMIKSAKLK